MNQLFKNSVLFSFVIIFLLSFGCTTRHHQNLREELNLAGAWKFQLDPELKGEKGKWYQSTLPEEVILPGSLDENKKGFQQTDTTDGHLNRPIHYVGLAWYQKEIEIPEKWTRKDVVLIIERTKVSKVWLDTIYLGSNNIIYAKQVYDLTKKITSGKHTLTIAVDNREELVPIAGSHAYSENTQTNWNGIIGRFCLEARDPVYIKKVRVFPEIESKAVKVEVAISELMSETGAKYSIQLLAELWNSEKTHFVKPKDLDIKELKTEVNYKLGDEAQLWSEFDPALYKLMVILKENGKPIDNYTLDFGLRDFSTKDKKFTINNKVTFLRGKHDAIVFPLTGYPPTNVEDWIKVIRISQSFGLNHYRFHTMSPPDAAFQAADICGVYVQTELPIWWGFNAQDSTQVEYLTNLGKHILDDFGNHASLVMFALGNEITQERKVLKSMVSELREHDPRPLYAQGSNNRLWDPYYAEGDDYFVSFRLKKDMGDNSTDIRTSMSFLDSKHGGILNAQYPSTSFNYDKVMEFTPVPAIGFEVGQYQVYPNYKEIPKYTGVVKPWNLELFRQRITEAGMADQIQDFFEASGQLSAICYRADIEAALRTAEFGGFHLLDLQDYPGQGTALVGMLDAFMDNKGLIGPEEFRQFCDKTVLLFSMDKFCWTNQETFHGKVLVANYNQDDINKKTINWKVKDLLDEQVIGSGKFDTNIIPQGSLSEIGVIEWSLEKIEKHSRLQLELSTNDGELKNSYPLWIYPEKQVEVPKGMTIVSRLDEKAKQVLSKGGKVLLIPEHKAIENHSLRNQFISDFWNWGMFKSLAIQFGGNDSPGTLGILTNPQHPLFNDFLTEFHTNWQWWPIVTYSQSFILDDTEPTYRPIVQIIDNINRNHKLGLVFEFKVGKGKLLVCTSDIQKILDKPEGRQFYQSMLNYVNSENFNPQTEIDMKKLEEWGL